MHKKCILQYRITDLLNEQKQKKIHVGMPMLALWMRIVDFPRNAKQEELKKFHKYLNRIKVRNLWKFIRTNKWLIECFRVKYWKWKHSPIPKPTKAHSQHSSCSLLNFCFDSNKHEVHQRNKTKRTEQIHNIYIEQ